MEVTIMGQSYVLACPPGGDDALHAAVRRVDEEMAAIRATGKVKARERIAVLAALNLAYATPAQAASSASSLSAAEVASSAAPSEAAWFAAPAAPAAGASPGPAVEPVGGDAGSAAGGATGDVASRGELPAEIEALLRRIDEQLDDEARPA